MKNLLRFMMVAVILMGISATAFSKDFKGVITYKITYPGMEIDPSMAAMMPKMATMMIRGNMSKFEISMGQMGSQIMITDGNEKTVTTCLDMMGQKLYYIETEEDLHKNVSDDTEVKIDIKDETKEIAGYECKKAVITVNQNGADLLFTVYFSEDIGSAELNFENPYFKEIPGAMLEFEIDTGGGRMMRMEAISVDKKNISDSEFEVPEGFEKKTSAEIKQIFGSGM